MAIYAHRWLNIFCANCDRVRETMDVCISMAFFDVAKNVAIVLIDGYILWRVGVFVPK